MFILQNALLSFPDCKTTTSLPWLPLKQWWEIYWGRFVYYDECFHFCASRFLRIIFHCLVFLYRPVITYNVSQYCPILSVHEDDDVAKSHKRQCQLVSAWGRFVHRSTADHQPGGPADLRGGERKQRGLRHHHTHQHAHVPHCIQGTTTTTMMITTTTTALNDDDDNDHNDDDSDEGCW